MLLSVPVRGDGTIDSTKTQIVEEIATWMKTNGECIFSTRPWKIFGEALVPLISSNIGQAWWRG